MSYFNILMANYGRRKLRTVLTLLSVIVAFLLFGVLAAAKHGISGQFKSNGENKLVTVTKVVPFAPMPVAYAQYIQSLPEVKLVGYSSAFAGQYQNPNNMVSVGAVNTATFFAVSPTMTVPKIQKQRWLHDRDGALIDKTLADRYNWKIGQVVPLKSHVRKKDGTTTWYFTIDGFYDAHGPLPVHWLVIHYKYFNLSRATGKDTVNAFSDIITSPSLAPIVEQKIDSHFANASPQTRTTSEAAMERNIQAQGEQIGGLIVGIAVVVFASMLLMVSAIIFHTLQERASEYATLLALGFNKKIVSTLIVAESGIVVLAGGLIGLALSVVLTNDFKARLVRYLPAFGLPPLAIGIGVALAVLFGILAGCAPARQMLRGTVASALTRT
jgi:putative ABC transport system permease protein